MTNLIGIASPELQFTLLFAGNNYVLANSPKGWEGTLITQTRDTSYYAAKRTYTVPMDFVLDGAYVLRMAFYTYGIQANVQLKIGQNISGSDQYNIISISDIDFSQFSDSENIVTVNAMDAGIESKIKAFGSTVYEIDLADGGFDIQLTPLVLQENAQFFITQDQQHLHSTSGNTNFFPTLNIVTNQQNATQSSVKAVTYVEQQTPDYSTSGAWFIQTKVGGPANLKGTISGQLVGGGTFTVFFVSRAGTHIGTVLNRAQANGSVNNFGIDYDFDFTTITDDTIMVRAEYQGTASGINQVGILMSGSILATYNTVSPSSNARAMRPFVLAEKLLAKMNGMNYPLQSYLLATEWYQLSITSGEAIRQLDSPVISISWNDFWQSINSVCNAEAGDINGTYTIERKAQAFKKTLPILNVGEVGADWGLSVYQEYIFNTISVGYEDVTLDRTGGRTEFNSGQKYTTPVTRIQRDLNLVSKIHAGILEIESLRVNFAGLETTDKSADNIPFFVYLKANISGDFYEPEGVEAFTSVTGVAPGIYNIKIAPKHNLYRHGDYIMGAMDKLSGGVIEFASADKDVSMVTIDSAGKRIAEGESVMISNLTGKLFLPYAVTFKCKFPRGSASAVTTLPNGYVDFTIDSIAYRGFILDVSIDIANNSSQQLKVLLTTDNDLSQLIR